MSFFTGARNIDAKAASFNTIEYQYNVSYSDKEDKTLRNFDNPAGKIWSIYVTESAKLDKALVENWKGDMDGMLIFAGLFSAVVVGFILENNKMLKEDSGDTTVALLRYISQQLDPMANGSQIPAPYQSTFQPTTSALRISTFWLLSFSSSILCALMATLVQRWARHYLQVVERHHVSHQQSRIRAYMYEGITTFHVAAIAEAIPALLHVSVFLFFAGLVEFILPINHAIAYTTLAITLLCGTVYLVATILPVVFCNCPFQTPLSPLCWRVMRLLRSPNARTKSADVGGDMVQGREAIATKESPSRDDRDKAAVRWTIECLTEHSEFERFVDGIPDFLGEVPGASAMFREFLLDSDIQLGYRISLLLESCSKSKSLLENVRVPRALAGIKAIACLSREIQVTSWHSLFGQHAKYTLHRLTSDRAPLVAHAAQCASAVVAHRLSHEMLESLLQVVTSIPTKGLTAAEVSCFLSLEMLGGIHALAKVVGIEDESQECWEDVVRLLQMCLMGDDTHPPTTKFQQVLAKNRMFALSRFLHIILADPPLPNDEGVSMTVDAVSALTQFSAAFADPETQVFFVQDIVEMIAEHGPNGTGRLSHSIIDNLLGVFFSLRDPAAKSQVKHIVASYLHIMPNSKVAMALFNVL